MGFSTSITVVIFAASFFYIASIVYPLADMSYQRVIEAEEVSYNIQYEKLHTRVVITNIQPNGSDLTVTVFNNGSVPLNSSRLNVLHNGAITSFFTVSEQGVWSPKSRINVTINGVNEGRVKIITQSGVADYAIT